MANESATLSINLFINFIGGVNSATIASLVQHLETYSRNVFLNKPGEPGQLSRVVKSKVGKIYLLINSGGGELEVANGFFEFVKALKNLPEIITYNIGRVDSAAIILFCVGKERYAIPNTRFIIHESVLAMSGELKRAKDTLKGGEELTNLSAKIISTTCKKDLEIVKGDIASHKYLPPNEAKEYGLITDIKTSLPTILDDDQIITITG